MKQLLTAEETETIIRWDRANDKASVYTCDPVVVRKLDRHPEIYKVTQTETMKGELLSKTYECEKRFISFRMTIPKPMSDEEKRIRSERAKAMFEKRKSK